VGIIGGATDWGGTLVDGLSTTTTRTGVELTDLEPQPLTIANTIAVVTSAVTASVPRPNPGSGAAVCGRFLELEDVAAVGGRNLAK
jgi:hypothetical protein